MNVWHESQALQFGTKLHGSVLGPATKRLRLFVIWWAVRGRRAAGQFRGQRQVSQERSGLSLYLFLS